MSNDSELSFDNINILNPFIQIKQTQIPIIKLVFEFKKYLIFKPRQIHIEIVPENNMSENENTTKDEIIVELTNHLNSVYPTLPTNRDDSI